MKIVYSNEAAYLGYEVKNGCLQIESEVFGEHESEKHYLFSDMSVFTRNQIHIP